MPHNSSSDTKLKAKIIAASFSLFLSSSNVNFRVPASCGSAFINNPYGPQGTGAKMASMPFLHLKFCRRQNFFVAGNSGIHAAAGD
jgi:hypothetical protein